MDKHEFVIIPADICNLTCSFCCVAKCEGSSSTIMTTEDAVKYADIIVKYIIRHKLEYINLTFFGGEPLLNFDVIKIFLQSVLNCYKLYNFPKEVKTVLFTNGTVNILEYIEFINSLNEECPIFSNEIQLSYDGPKHLCSSVSEKTDLTNIKKAVELTKCNKNWNVHCMVVLSNHNSDNFFALYKFLQKENVLDIMHFRLDIENKNYIDLGNSILPQLQLVIDYIKGSYDSGIKKIAKENFYKYLYNGQTRTCCAGITKIGISANGMLGSCHHDIVLVNNSPTIRTFMKLTSMEDIENFCDLTFSNEWYDISRNCINYEDICPSNYEKVKDDPDRKEFFRKVHEIVKQLDEGEVLNDEAKNTNGKQDIENM